VDSEDESEVDPAILNEYAAEVQPCGTVELPGLYLVDPSVDYFDGQIIYLDFDGEEEVTYDGPIVVEGINVPAFSAPDYLVGKEQAIIIEVLEDLNEIFAGSGVVFTTEKPDHGASYSTIYVGGDDSAFAEYGSFLGLAERVDIANQSTHDKGFVFSDNIGSDFGITGSYSAELSHVIAHEIGHLLGYAHNNNHADSGILSAVANGVTFGSQQVISTQTDSAYSVYACDLDGDGDNDVLSASLSDDKIAWYENLGGGSFSVQQVISTQADGAHWVYACDLDGDGDNDVISASVYDDKIAWYENRLNEPTADFGSQQVISTQADEAASVYACDLDGDGDNDVLSASIEDDKIAWYENLGGGTSFSTQKVIGTDVDYAASVYACDLDGDGDNDVLSTSRYNDRIAWYENDGSGNFGGKQSISTDADGAMSVYACDLDGDGDNDVLSASWYDDKIAWYENLGGGSFGTQQVISTQADGTYSLYACDLDGDGDNDVLSTSWYDDKIAWYENLGGGSFGTQQVISTQADGTYSLYACDLDGDGDSDVLSASYNDDKIAWYENLISAGVGSPEIDVERNGTDDVHTHSFGTLNPAQSISQAFTVRNEGNADLVVTQAAGLVSPFSISPLNSSGITDDWVIPAGGMQTFTVSFFPVNPGNYSDTLVLTSNDSDEGSYLIDFTGTASGPEIEVLGNSQVILDGDTTPDPSDHTDFGSVGVGGSLTRTFTIRNTGAGALNLTGVPTRVQWTCSTDFTVVQQPGSPVAAYGGTTTFQIRFTPSGTGLKTATVWIPNNDSNENPYNFMIQGTGLIAEPEMDVLGNSQIILDGDTTPDPSDHTDFGSVGVGGSLTRTFTIRNTGAGALNLTGVPTRVQWTCSTDFTVVQQPGSPVAAYGGTTTFQIRFTPSGTGLKTATVWIPNNDSNENPYNFAIQGTGLTSPGPQILLSEDFNDGNYNGWALVEQGTIDGPMAWSAATGVMVQSSNVYSLPLGTEIPKLGTYAYWQGGTGWTDYKTAVTIKSADDDAIGIMFRYQDENNYYRFSWDKQRNYRRLVKCVNGQFTLLAEDSVQYVTGQNYQVKIVAQGSTLQVSIDGSPVFSVNDSSLSSGTIALYNWGNIGSYFDDIRVTVLGI